MTTASIEFLIKWSAESACRKWEMYSFSEETVVLVLTKGNQRIRRQFSYQGVLAASADVLLLEAQAMAWVLQSNPMVFQEPGKKERV
jgi:hypothetical protein